MNNNLKNLGKKSKYDSIDLDLFYSYSNDNNSYRNKNEKLNKSQNELSKISKNNNFSPKIKFPKEDRYFNAFYKNERNEKYMPGPADYSPEKDYEKKNIFRYDSLFKTREFYPLIEIKPTTAEIGPGSYELIKDKNVPGGVFSKLKKYDNFNNPFVINDKDIQTYFGTNIPGSINIKDIFKKNYFFMINSPRKEKLEKKLGLIRNDNTINNVINKRINKNVNNMTKGKSINFDWVNATLKKKIKERIKSGTIIVDDINKEINDDEKDNINNNSIKEIMKNKGKMYSFNKIPRFFELSNKHVPGPSYYDPDKIMAGIKLKKDFNAKENNWI